AASRIGTQLPGEKDSIKAALRGVPLTSEFDGRLSVELPLRFRSGVGGPAVVELTHPDAPIASAAGPWRTNALFLFPLLVLLGVAVFGVARVLAVVSDTADGRVETRPVVIPRPVRAAAPHPGLREEGEARRRAEERARAAEGRLVLLQDQYRKTLEELQSFQQLARETRSPATVDPRIEERALRAEGQVNELELQLRTVTQERERLATQLQETIQEALRVVDDDEQDLRLREAELEAIGLNAELDVTKEQLDATRRELASTRASTGAASRSQEELDAVNVEMLQLRDALTSVGSQRETELHGRITGAETAARGAVNDLQAARDEVTAARAEAASREQQLLEAHNEIARIRGELKGHASEVKERTATIGQARKEADDMRRSFTALQEDLTRADETIEQMRTELEAERLRNAETEDV